MNSSSINQTKREPVLPVVAATATASATAAVMTTTTKREMNDTSLTPMPPQPSSKTNATTTTTMTTPKSTRKPPPPPPPQSSTTKVPPVKGKTKSSTTKKKPPPNSTPSTRPEENSKDIIVDSSTIDTRTNDGDGGNHDRTTSSNNTATPSSSASKGGRAKSSSAAGNSTAAVDGSKTKTYMQLVEEAIVTLKEYRTGSSLASIKKYIITNYPHLYDVSQNNYFNARINMALKTGCQTKPIPRFQKVKVSYRIAPEYKTNMSNKKRQEQRKSVAVMVAKAKSSASKKRSHQQQQQQQQQQKGNANENGSGHSKSSPQQQQQQQPQQLSAEELQIVEERRRKREEAKQIKAAEEARMKQVMERIRRRKFPIEDTKLHQEDKMYNIKPPVHVTTRPYIPYFWYSTVPLNHPNRYGGKTTSTILNASKVDTSWDVHDTRGIVPDLLHVYHFFMGDIHFLSQQHQSDVHNNTLHSSSSSSFNLKQLIYSCEQMINGTMKRTRCLPPFIAHLFVTCLQVLLTLPNDNNDGNNNNEITKGEKQLRHELHQYLYPALSAASWSDVTYLYMDAMQRFYITDSSYNPNSIPPLLTDVNYLFCRTEEPSISLLMSPPPKQKRTKSDMIDDEGNGEDTLQAQHPIPDGYVGYLGDERSTLHRAHTKLARQDPWLLTGEEIIALLRALTEDVLASHPATGKDIEQRDDQMIELMKNKRAADMKFRKVRLAYEGPKKPPPQPKTKNIEIETTDDNNDENGTGHTETTGNGKENGDTTKVKPFVPTATRKQYDVAIKAQEKANDSYEKGTRKFVARTVPVGYDRNYNAVYCFVHDPQVLYYEEKKPPTDNVTFNTSSSSITIPHDMQFPRTSWHVIESTSLCDKYASSLDIRGKREYDLYEALMGPPGHTNLSLCRYLYDDIKVMADAKSKVREKEMLVEKLKIAQIKCDEEKGRRSGRLAGQAEIELIQIQQDIIELEAMMEKHNKKTTINVEPITHTTLDYKELTGFNSLVQFETSGRNGSNDTRRATRDKKGQLESATPTVKKLPLLYCSKLYPTGNIDGTGLAGILVSNMLELEERCNSLAAWDRSDITRSNWISKLENTVSMWHQLCPDLFGAPTTEPSSNKITSSSIESPMDSSTRSQLKRDSMGSESGFPSSKRSRKTDSPSISSMGSCLHVVPTVASIITMIKQPLLDLEERVADITNVALATKDADLADDNMSTTDDDDDNVNRERMELEWKRLINKLRNIPARRNSKIRNVLVDAITSARKAHLQAVVAELRDALLLFRPNAPHECKMAAIRVLISHGGYDATDDDEQEEDENNDNTIDEADNLDNKDSLTTEDTVPSVLSAEAVILRSSLGGSDDARREDWVGMVKSVKTMSRLAALTAAFIHDAMQEIGKVEAERDELVSALQIWSKAEERQSKQRDTVAVKAKNNTAREVARPSEVWADVRYTDEICMAKTDEYPWWPAKMCEAKDPEIAKSLKQLKRSLVAFVGEMGSLRVVKTSCIKPFVGNIVDDGENMDEYKKDIRTQLDDCMAMARRIQRGLSKMKKG